MRYFFKALIHLSEIGRKSALSLPAERQKNPERGSAPGPRGRVRPPRTFHRGLGLLDHLPPFRQYQDCYDKHVILPRMWTYAIQLIVI